MAKHTVATSIALRHVSSRKTSTSLECPLSLSMLFFLMWNRNSLCFSSPSIPSYSALHWIIQELESKIMEQSRLAATRFYRAFFLAHNQTRKRGFAAASSTSRTADPNIYSKERDRDLKPAVPSGKPEETKTHYEPEPAKREVLEKETETEYVASKETEPLGPRRLLHAAAPRLESIGVNNPIEPFIQQKRENSTVILEEISCAGLDGTPWPTTEKGTDEQEDDNDYYRHHKASPLSEIKIADTRKPITRATDAGQDYGLGRDVIGWLPEQVETAEETLERASRIWRENAMRGDPDTPHGRILRVLRGEWF